MASGFQNINLTQGSSFSLDFIATDDFGAVLNLTGFSGIAPIKTNYSTGNPIGYFNLTFGQSGALNISLPSTGSAALPTTICLYEIEVASGNYVIKPRKGYAYIFPQISTTWP